MNIEMSGEGWERPCEGPSKSGMRGRWRWRVGGAGRMRWAMERRGGWWRERVFEREGREWRTFVIELTLRDPGRGRIVEMERWVQRESQK